MPLTQEEAAHLLRRVGFVGDEAEIAHFAGREVADVVDEILALTPTQPSRPAFAQSGDTWPGIETFRQWWVQRMIDARWVGRGAATPSPLEEKLTLFWHSHFATGARKVEDLRAMWRQHDILRRRCRGRFGDLLNAVCTDGALLVFLDNQLNTVDEPQENFARELMELYTIGPEAFIERDVVEMTRSWTGHGTVGWVGNRWNQAYEFHPEDHDDGSKTIFGQTRNWNGPETLELFTSPTGPRHDACAAFLARKFWRFFVDDAPSESGIADLAGALGPDLDITAMLRTLLLSDAFWAPRARFSLVRSPIEFAVVVLRRTGVDADESGIHWQMGQMGQSLLEPPSVAGWGTHDAWVSTQIGWGKAQFVTQMRWNEDVHTAVEAVLGGEPWEDGAISPAEAAQRLIDHFAIPEPSAETRSALAQLWRVHGRRDGWAAKHNAIVAATLCPEYQVA